MTNGNNSVDNDELIGFISPTLYISRYVPTADCGCGSNNWGRVTTFYASGETWKGFVWCMDCKDRTFWSLNPDLPIASQAVKSNKPLVNPDELD